MAKRTVLTRLDEEKAQRWSLALEDILEEDRCDAAIASKFAGRFSWTVTMQADKVGRAYIRGWYALLMLHCQVVNYESGIGLAATGGCNICTRGQ